MRRVTEAVDVWVDAICINQSDSKEVAAQVERMPEIYRNAERVLIGLRSGAP
jgi:hypothetical protein